MAMIPPEVLLLSMRRVELPHCLSAVSLFVLWIYPWPVRHTCCILRPWMRFIVKAATAATAAKAATATTATTAVTAAATVAAFVHPLSD